MINPATLHPGARLDACEKSSLTNPPENKPCTFRVLRSLKRCSRVPTSCLQAPGLNVYKDFPYKET